MSEKNKAEEINDLISEEQSNLEVDKVQEESKTIEEQLQDDLDKEKDKFLRLFAEFENFKKRTSKERMDLFKTAGQEVIVSLLPVLDDFERALKELSKSDDKEMFKGIELINGKLKETLKSKGMEEVVAEQGDAFDAEIMKAFLEEFEGVDHHPR